MNNITEGMRVVYQGIRCLVEMVLDESSGRIFVLRPEVVRDIRHYIATESQMEGAILEDCVA